MIRTCLTTFKKDLRIEWRSPSRMVGGLCFAMLILILFSFAAGPDSVTLGRHAAGYVWLAILLTSIINLGASMRAEFEDQALEALRLLPVNVYGFFLGKLLANAVQLSFTAAILWPVAGALFEVYPTLGIVHLLGITIVGAFAISAPGTLYATMAAQLKSQDVMFPVLLFPILTPALVAAVKATSLVLMGDPMNEYAGWLTVLVIFAWVYTLLGLVLFEHLIEE